MEDQSTTNGFMAKVAAGRGAGRDSDADEDSSSSVNPNNGSSSNNSNGQIQQELPFLVTHWLANYGRRGGNNDGRNNNLDDSNTSMTTSNSHAGDDTSTNSLQQQREREEALSTIRRATSELASAFSVLGAYGSTMQVRWWGSTVRKLEFIVAADAFVLTKISASTNHSSSGLDLIFVSLYSYRVLALSSRCFT